MASILVLHGPNLNLLGTREPEIYGNKTLTELNAELMLAAMRLGHQLTNYQSNAEHELIDAIHAATQRQQHFIIFNPAAFTHTSIALRDALSAVAIPFIEVHISDIKNREPFRQFSYFSDIAQATISGKGTDGYLMALETAHQFLTK